MYYDVLICGASLAGATTSFLLGQEGLSVACVDPSSFPRSKSCGEGLSSMGRKIARDIFGSQFEDSLSFKAPFHSFAVFHHSGKKNILPFASLENSTHWGIGIRRFELDQKVQQFAQQTKNVDFFLGDPITILQSLPNKRFRWQNSSTTVESSTLVIADGARSPTSQLLNLPCKQKKVSRFGISLDLSLSSYPDTLQRHVAVVSEPSLQACFTYVGHERLTLSVFFDKKKRSPVNPSRPEEIITHLQRYIPFEGTLQTALQGASRFGEFRRPATIGNIHLVGDSREQFDPIGGMGMTHALISAVETAERILSIHPKTRDLKKLSLLPASLSPWCRALTRLSYCGTVLGAENRFWASLQQASFSSRLLKALHHPSSGTLAASFFLGAPW